MKYLTLSDLHQMEKVKYINEISIFLKDIVIEYPLHNIWYNRMINSIGVNCDREILLAIEDAKILGVAILKNSSSEKKICTLRVDQSFQKNGIGSTLVAKSMEMLETDKPIITVSNRKYHEFDKLFKYFGFNLESVYYEKYKMNTFEFVYNGILLPETFINPGLEKYETNKLSVAV